ncbi:inhibitor of KinA [Melghirimyces profundicolus]|uniref:Inhibitor of KinA n=1 Tax=Melghirimyces profundicolus TaxID=1242148 RepID=A0A2T6BS21_9BACL|nr:5-oxoprolinase subunit PxpB [Melghirimyces profundicolus]PTX58844.1 inhibitor of KinA [Melghirimyces profundicolus]
MKLQFHPLGDTGVRIGFGERIDPGVNREIRSFVNQLERSRIPGVVEWVPAYTSLTVYYRPWDIRYPDLLKTLKEMERIREPVSDEDVKVVELPVVYGGAYGPDLGDVARINGLTPEDVVRIHSGASYRVYMLGFAPGFPYLGGMPEEIATPRLENPRSRIPAGSVGIAEGQTGVYPLETPGGWRIIGRTPLRLYDPGREPPVLLKAGDAIRFRPVTEEEYGKLEGNGGERKPDGLDG